MKLTYWVAENLTDSTAYNIRTRTKKEAVAQVKAWSTEGEYNNSYGPVKSVTVEYNDGFDLMVQCLSEGSGHWEL